MLRDEAGFTLIELLVTATLMLVILGAVLTVLGTTTRLSAQDRERALVIREGEEQLDALTRTARHAYRVHSATESRLDLGVHEQGRTWRVVFDCSPTHPTLPGLRQCRRHEVLANGATTAPRVVVDRVVSPAVFAPTLRDGVIAYIRVTLRLPASGERRTGPKHELRLESGIALRNAGVVA